MAGNRTGKGRYMRLLLVASLALNLIIIGAGLGMFSGHVWRKVPPRLDLGAAAIMRALDGPQRNALRNRLHGEGVFHPQDRDAMQSDRMELLAVLRADQFDPDGFRSVLVRQGDRLARGQEALRMFLADEIADMNRTERLSFANRVEENMRRSSVRQPRPTR